jgi:glutathione S-transferase
LSGIPVLEHDGFMLYETQAILRYLDRVLPAPPLPAAGGGSIILECVERGAPQCLKPFAHGRDPPRVDPIGERPRVPI